MSECFYVNVNDLMDRAESINELGIISISGKDSDYHERSEFNGLYPMVQ